MPADSKSLVGPGRFQWNAGAWFGSTIGSCAWMAVATCLLVIHKQGWLANVPAIGFAAVCLAAIAMWTHRNRIYPFTALMTLLSGLAIVLPIVWIVITTRASPEALAAMNWPRSIETAALVCAIAPVLMLWFALLERDSSARTKAR